MCYFVLNVQSGVYTVVLVWLFQGLFCKVCYMSKQNVYVAFDVGNAQHV